MFRMTLRRLLLVQSVPGSTPTRKRTFHSFLRLEKNSVEKQDSDLKLVIVRRLREKMIRTHSVACRMYITAGRQISGPLIVH